MSCRRAFAYLCSKTTVYVGLNIVYRDLAAAWYIMKNNLYLEKDAEYIDVNIVHIL